jgi:hypothetical protein
MLIQIGDSSATLTPFFAYRHGLRASELVALRWGTTSNSPLGACMYAGPRAGMPACIRYRRGKAARCASSCAKPQRPHTSSSRSAARRGDFHADLCSG